ncbi:MULTISPECIES: glycosyltransferase family 4 protein [Protofrankia]|uniref:Glycosyl transferase group 1 n=1 Tax=Candidatus Protofrankia datiscae TaxID=2716812 RepID=F8B2Y2_9ACTN|nr:MULTISPECIES: glycosyltransferase family 4 protein [Protofrankia]AEH08966.1 glycosyl transferase group 1 [Candidatus Protofrankia datiscae]
MPVTAAPAGSLSRRIDALAGRRVVFLNWRDLDHPQAGGAELYCQSVAERFAAAGARVSLLTARPAGQTRSATVRGVEIHRRGGTFGVYPAVLAQLLRDRRGVDAVVDCQNGIPFFSPLVLPASTAVIQVLHHVHQRQFPLYFPAPVARIGQLLETPGSRWVYGRRPVAVVSPSTRDEARDVLKLAGPRFIVPGGADSPLPGPARPASPRPADRPTIVCVGRLVPHKRLHLLIDALPALRASHPGLVVEMVGDGPDRDRLLQHAHERGVGEEVLHWHGYVDAAERDRLLSTAWLTVNPSHGEGWGLSVLEANAHGVPAVAFRVPGLRDAVRDGHTGWLVDEPGPLTATIDAALSTLADPAVAARWRSRARAWAAGFTWDATAELLARVVTAEMDRLAAARGRGRRSGRGPLGGQPPGGNAPAGSAPGGSTPGGPLPGWRRLPGRRPRGGSPLDESASLSGPASAGRRRGSRRADDVVTRAEFPLAPTRPLPTLRRTDLVYRLTGDDAVPDRLGGQAAAGRAVAVLYGASPADARAALTRAGVTGQIEARAATGEDLLIAATRCALPDPQPTSGTTITPMITKVG